MDFNNKNVHHNRITNLGKHAFVRADFRRYAFDRTGAVKRSAGAFVCAAAVAYVATFAFFFVVVQKFSNLIASRLVKAGENVPLHIVGVWV